MGGRSLELRDLEILRALVRVRYLTSRQITNAFFSCPRVGRRRVQRLSELDLIRPHAKGLSELLRYSAWRITSRGVDEVGHALPDEPIPDGLIERVMAGSLKNPHHREALADLYMGLVVPNRSELAEADRAAHRRWAAEMRSRAALITWQPDGDVILSASYLGARTDVIPDAVARAESAKLRVFIELDRSNKDLGRIRENLERYARLLPRFDLGGDRPTILYVVRSAARKANITKLARTILDLPPTLALLQVEAVEWLRVELLSLPAEPPPQTRLRSAAINAYGFMRQLERLLEQKGIRATLDGEQPDFMKNGRLQFLELYHSLKALPAADR